MSYYEKFIKKYGNQKQKTREEEFQFAILQAFNDIWKELRNLNKGLRSTFDILKQKQ
ncbi:hypothetical protein LCGC14_1111440 [marine sediment metagenome]|uniref:Uncharacterized protein n=1 Tax=marine sediment metagenome TaxID=412755 RepID=A0A0F9QCP4_9ZZZZ